MIQEQILGKTGIKVRKIALGCEHLQGKDEALVRSVIERAVEKGIDFLDVFMSEPNVRTYIGRTLKGRRKDLKIQGHIGAIWENGQYAVSRDLDCCKYFFDDLLTRLNTAYIDVGYIHCLDDYQEWERLTASKTLEYVQDLKDKKVIHALGLSTHNPITAKRAVESGLIDVLMFALNPIYDLIPPDQEIWPIVEEKPYDYSGMDQIRPERQELYRLCESKDIPIIVMKSLGAGALLSKERSPYEEAMSVLQCIHYAFTRPAVAAVMLGMQTVTEVNEAISYYDATDKEKDYSEILAARTSGTFDGRCMYCNHCLPCEAGIDIASVNKYLDLVEMDQIPAATVQEHYAALGKTAEDCLECYSCEQRCPFNVSIVERMDRARLIFN